MKGRVQEGGGLSTFRSGGLKDQLGNVLLGHCRSVCIKRADRLGETIGLAVIRSVAPREAAPGADVTCGVDSAMEGGAQRVHSARAAAEAGAARAAAAAAAATGPVNIESKPVLLA